jgi:hypothetical protein
MCKDGKRIEYEVVFKTDNPNEAYEKEKSLISEIGRRDAKNGSLLNLTGGGEGVINYQYTDEHRKNLSKSIKLAIKEGRFNSPRRFDSRSKEEKEKISKTLINFWESDEGLTQKEKLSELGKKRLKNGKRVLSTEARKKMSESSYKRTEEHKRNASVRMRDIWEERKKHKIP